MNGYLRIVKGTEVKLMLPGPSISIKADGTLWYSGSPILGINDPEEKKRVVALVRSQRWSEIPDIYFTRLGHNPNGLWAGGDKEWASHSAKAEQTRLAVTKIYLSSRGWGDYSPCEWEGDITRPDNEIIEECMALLGSGYDVDQPCQSAGEIMAKIAKARAEYEAAPARKAAREAKKKTGYCFACESWCHGDCGHYSNDPMIKFHRALHQTQRDADYGIND